MPQVKAGSITPAFQHERRAVALVEGQVVARRLHPVAEQGRVPGQLADHLLGVGIEQEFVGVESMSRGGLVGSVDPVAIDGPRPRIGQVAVPDLVGVFRQSMRSISRSHPDRTGRAPPGWRERKTRRSSRRGRPRWGRAGRADPHGRATSRWPVQHRRNLGPSGLLGFSIHRGYGGHERGVGCRQRPALTKVPDAVWVFLQGSPSLRRCERMAGGKRLSGAAERLLYMSRVKFSRLLFHSEIREALFSCLGSSGRAPG